MLCHDKIFLRIVVRKRSRNGFICIKVMYMTYFSVLLFQIHNDYVLFKVIACDKKEKKCLKIDAFLKSDIVEQGRSQDFIWGRKNNIHLYGWGGAQKNWTFIRQKIENFLFFYGRSNYFICPFFKAKIHACSGS